MGEGRFFPGDKAPNDGTYIEDGVNSFHKALKSAEGAT